MKTLSTLLLSILLLGFSTVSQAAAYDTDPQAQYPKDQTQDTFSFASQIACIIRGMAPEKNVGVGQYLAFVDESKCNDSGGAAGGSTANGASASVQTNYSKALVTVVQGSAGELKVDVLFKVTDEDNGVQKPKDIQVLITIFGGVNVAPPYGRWVLDYCSSTAGIAGTCDDGSGYLRVSSDGLVVFENSTDGYRAGRSVFSDGSGNNGYGSLYTRSDRWPSNNANTLFAFAPGKYVIQDRESNQNFCYNPSTSAPGVRFSTWENYLYDRSTKERITYENPGFYLKSNFTDKTVGDVSYWGVHFWNDADAGDQLDGATLRNAKDTSQTYTLKKTPGRLQKVSISTATSLDSIDGIPLNLTVWGNDQDLLRNLAGVTLSSGNGVSLRTSWSKANQLFTFSGYTVCNSNGCDENSFTDTTRSLAELVALDISGVNAWVNGVNTNYTFRIAERPASVWVGIPQADIQLIKQASTVVAPNDTTIPANLVCVGNCPKVVNGVLTDVQNQSWPPTTFEPIAWNAARGAPEVSGGGATVLVDWTNPSNPRGYWYQFYSASDLDAMRCNYWNGSANVPGGYCTDRVNNQPNVTYYTWQTGNRWDAYNYLVYNNGSKAGQAVAPNPPLSLSYTVPDTQGNLPGYVGKTITVQSPQPGSIWLPGSCVNSVGQKTPCTNDTNWVNDVSIPTAANDTGSVTLLNANGNPTTTKYFVKWLKRGVYFEGLNASECTPLTGGLTQADSLQLPGISDYNISVKTLGLPWPTEPFNGQPRVIDGVLQ